MNELNRVIDQLGATGARVLNVERISRSETECTLIDVTNKGVPPGHYVVAELRVLIPADK